VLWARSPVPFPIALTGGQQGSLPWVKPDGLDNPGTPSKAALRVLLDVLFFRPLFRNTESRILENSRLAYASSKWLWAGAMAFHWSLLAILLRHLRFFTEPIPGFVLFLQGLDGLFDVGTPVLYISTMAFLVSLAYLFARRLAAPQVRAISLHSDYFALLLIGAIALSGIIMRHFLKTDVRAAKKLVMSLVAFNPAIPDGTGPLVFIHVFLVCALLAFFPFSKLLHMPGVFLSPVKNLIGASRSRRHENPWNPPVKVHGYPEWEKEFAERLRASGYPMEEDRDA
jgi:nitrate reductase gamma subunit